MKEGPQKTKASISLHLSLCRLHRCPRMNTDPQYSPVVRTNPVTGWKSLFGAGHQVHAGWIDNVTETESEIIKDYCKCRRIRITR
jgi:hypothetical protein